MQVRYIILCLFLLLRFAEYVEVWAAVPGKKWESKVQIYNPIRSSEKGFKSEMHIYELIYRYKSY